jgi:hypothetical protein
MLQCVLQICSQWFEFKLKSFFSAAPATSKKGFKSRQNQLGNNHLSTNDPNPWKSPYIHPLWTKKKFAQNVGEIDLADDAVSQQSAHLLAFLITSTPTDLSIKNLLLFFFSSFDFEKKIWKTNQSCFAF